MQAINFVVPDAIWQLNISLNYLDNVAAAAQSDVQDGHWWEPGYSSNSRVHGLGIQGIRCKPR